MKVTTAKKFKPHKPLVKRSAISGTSAHLIGALRGKIRVTGDITSSGRKWHAQS